MCDSKPTAKKVTAKGAKSAKAAVKGKPAPRKQACAKKTAGAKPATAKRKPAAAKTTARKAAGAKPTAAKRKPAAPKTPVKKAAGTKPATTKRKTAAPKTTAQKVVETVAEPITGPNSVEFESNTSVAMVKSLHTVLTTALDRKTDIILDASNIEMTDTAVLQLLSAFTLQARKENLEVRWESPSEPFLAAAKLLDLEQHLGLAVAHDS